MPGRSAVLMGANGFANLTFKPVSTRKYFGKGSACVGRKQSICFFTFISVAVSKGGACFDDFTMSVLHLSSLQQ